MWCVVSGLTNSLKKYMSLYLFIVYFVDFYCVDIVYNVFILVSRFF